MYSTLTIYWTDSDGKRGQNCVQYLTTGGVSAAEQAVENWEQSHSGYRVYGVSGLPINLLPPLPKPARRRRLTHQRAA